MTVQNATGVTDIVDEVFGFRAENMRAHRHAQSDGRHAHVFLESRTNPPLQIVLSENGRKSPETDKFKVTQAFVQQLDGLVKERRTGCGR